MIKSFQMMSTNATCTANLETSSTQSSYKGKNTLHQPPDKIFNLRKHFCRPYPSPKGQSIINGNILLSQHPVHHKICRLYREVQVQSPSKLNDLEWQTWLKGVFKIIRASSLGNNSLTISIFHVLVSLFIRKATGSRVGC